MSTELTTMGVTMFDLISKETNNREMRLQYSNLPLELNYVEKSIKQAIAAMKTQLTNAMVGLESNNSEISNLNMKIQRKQSELLRNKQRFNTLQKIRPAYLEEFEKIEESLKELYVQYSVRIQTLNALKSFVVSFNTPTSVSPMNKVQDSSIPILPEEDLTDSNDEEEEPSEDDVIFKDESLQQDLLKQVSSRLKSRNEKKSLDSKIGKLDELTISESSNESDELEGSELEFSNLFQYLVC